MAKAKQANTRVRGDLLAIAARFVSTEETRYYLNGVYIEPHKDGGALMVATDGHIMGVVYDAGGICEHADIWPITKALAVQAGKRHLDTAHVSFDGTFATVEVLGVPEFAALSKPIDGTFPEKWRQCWPVELKCGAHPLSFNAGHMASFKPPRDKCAQMYSPGPADPTVILWPSVPEFTGLIMPMRTEELTLPGWLVSDIKPAKK